jgi:hypothetical protein
MLVISWLRAMKFPIVVALAGSWGLATLLCGAQEPQPLFKVSGVVRNRLNGQPIARALVDGQNDAVLTDREGRFELWLPLGYVGLQVRRPGYSSREARRVRNISVEADISGLNLLLTPTASITGHLSGEETSNASGISFMAYRRLVEHSHPQWRQEGLASTDADGTFKMYEIESPGDYVVCTGIFRDWSRPGDEKNPAKGYAAHCYPADPGDGPENLLHVGESQQAEMEIPRILQPFFPVKIAVPGYPQGQGVSVQIYSQNGPPTAASMQWKEKTLTMESELPNGSYYAEANVWGTPMKYGRVDFKVENAPVDVKLVVSPLAPIEVEIHKEFTSSTDQEAQLRATGQMSFVKMGPGEDPPPVNMQMTPADGMMFRGGSMPLQHRQGASNSIYDLEGVTPGRYWVQATTFAQAYVSSMTSGAVDLMQEPLTVGPGNSVAPIEITMRDDMGEIDCTFNTEMASPQGGSAAGRFLAAMSGPAVFAVPVGPAASRAPHMGFSAMGRVQIPNLPPGTYRVMAVENAAELSNADPEFLAHLAEKGKTVAVAAGETVNVRLDLTKTGEEEPNP